MENAFQARLAVRAPDCWAAHVSRNLQTRIEISGFKALSDDLVRLIAKIDIGEPRVPKTLDALRRAASVVQCIVCEHSAGHLVLMIDARSCVACRVAAESESVVANAAYGARGDLEWATISEDAPSLKSLLLALQDRGCPAEIVALSFSKGGSEMTGRQREVLSAAVGMGYFEDPKRTSLLDL